MMHVGNGVIALYGGNDAQEQPLSDYWHLKVDVTSRTVEAKLIQNGDSENKLVRQILNKEGAVMVALASKDFPVIFGDSTSAAVQL